MGLKKVLILLLCLSLFKTAEGDGHDFSFRRRPLPQLPYEELQRETSEADQEIKKAFLKRLSGGAGVIYTFDPLKLASEFLEKFKDDSNGQACKEVYNRLQENRFDKSIDLSSLINMSSCLKEIIKTYQNAYKDNTLVRIEQAFNKTNIKKADADFVEETKDCFTEYNKFDGYCLQRISKSSSVLPGGAKVMVSTLRTNDFKDKFELLRSYNCNEHRKKQQACFKKIKNLFKTAQTNCQNPQSECLSQLKMKVHLQLHPEFENQLVFFPKCSQAYLTAHNCCLSPFHCGPLVKASREAYSPQLQSTAQQGSCSANSPQLSGLNSQIQSKIQGICHSEIETCRASCDEEVADFKTKFQECFFVPDFTPETWTHHNHVCRAEIKGIKEAYKKWNEKKTELTSQSQGSDVADCQQIKKLFQQQNKAQLARQTVNGLCQQVAEEQGFDPNQLNNIFSSPTIKAPEGGPEGRNPQEQGQVGPPEFTPPGQASTGNEGKWPTRKPAASSPKGPMTALPGPKAQEKNKNKAEGKPVEDYESDYESAEESFGGGHLFIPGGDKGSEDKAEGSGAFEAPSGYGEGSAKGMTEEERELMEKELERMRQSGGSHDDWQTYGLGAEGGDSGNSRGLSFLPSPLRRFADRMRGGEEKESLSGRPLYKVMNIHPPGTDLLKRQKELFCEFCYIHKTCGENLGCPWEGNGAYVPPAHLRNIQNTNDIGSCDESAEYDIAGPACFSGE